MKEQPIRLFHLIRYLQEVVKDNKTDEFNQLKDVLPVIQKDLIKLNDMAKKKELPKQ